jgi:hypothetical protein
MRCHQSGRRKKQNRDSESKHSADGRSGNVNGPKRNDVLQVLRSSAELSAVYAIVITQNLELEELLKRSSLDQCMISIIEISA